MTLAAEWMAQHRAVWDRLAELEQCGARNGALVCHAVAGDHAVHYRYTALGGAWWWTDDMAKRHRVAFDAI